MLKESKKPNYFWGAWPPFQIWECQISWRALLNDEEGHWHLGFVLPTYWCSHPPPPRQARCPHSCAAVF